ncbi:MAG: N-acetyltransferase family protein [Pseudomonadales bacterium]
MQTNITIRHAIRHDLPALTEIYNYYVCNTPITFDVSPFEPHEREPWLNQFTENTRHQLLVVSQDGIVNGYASSAPLRPKQAYETSVECTIYLRPGSVGQGLGKQLYSALFSILADQDIHRCYGIITLPNEASIRLHHAFGFKEVARLTEVGRKFDRYWDTLWMEKAMSRHGHL